ncbi:hypothetical protein EYF80_013565 [Liparis tanakae]|uniref:Uncharacterized protein n=1 Tax=Liparis tanakae TaxID=230148 RepID=A0A4Z2IEF3_9TELE|nr:hypothetical protein EYF80_013565 [Liparis tanakae]
METAWGDRTCRYRLVHEHRAKRCTFELSNTDQEELEHRNVHAAASRFMKEALQAVATAPNGRAVLTRCSSTCSQRDLLLPTLLPLFNPIARFPVN